MTKAYLWCQGNHLIWHEKSPFETLFYFDPQEIGLGVWLMACVL